MKKSIIKSNLRFFLTIALILLVFVRCDEDNSYFPYVSVNVIISIDTQLENVSVGKYKEIDGYGLGGLIIYRYDFNVYQAFDRACTYEASSDCVLNDDISIYKCPCCESQFLMTADIAGSVFQGPANNPLKQYKCTLINLNSIRVTN